MAGGEVTCLPHFLSWQLLKLKLVSGDNGALGKAFSFYAFLYY